jgi:hypothetical protein
VRELALRAKRESSRCRKKSSCFTPLALFAPRREALPGLEVRDRPGSLYSGCWGWGWRFGCSCYEVEAEMCWARRAANPSESRSSYTVSSGLRPNENLC